MNNGKKKNAKDESDQRSNAAVKGAIDGGSDDTNGGQETKFTDRTRVGEMQVVKTHHELMNEIDRYDELLNEKLDKKLQEEEDGRSEVDIIVFGIGYHS